MKCPECEFENREEAGFCSECGHKFELICPKCKTTIRAASKFCDTCGYELRKTQKAPPIDYNQPQSYTPKHLADKILHNRSAIEGERKLVTVLFADIADYTSIAEKLDPEEVHQIMDGCFKILMDEVHRYEGTVNQFTGDGVMALFGAPVAHEDHAQRACHAALSGQKAMTAYGEKIKAEIGMDFLMRIGLNSGPVVVGTIGDDLRMDYTAAGDTTNLAARIQCLAEPGTVLASENSYRLTKDFFEFDNLGPIDVKGKSNPVAVFRATQAKNVHSRIEVSAGRGFTPLVARKAELDELMAAFAKTKDGQGQIVSIIGEAGVGKSRLGHEFKERLAGEDIVLWEAYCPAYGQDTPYLPIAQIIKQYSGIEEGDDEVKIRQKVTSAWSHWVSWGHHENLDTETKLEFAIAYLSNVISIRVRDGLLQGISPETRKRETFDGLKATFVGESQSKPVVVILEDIHWIDQTSEEFLLYLSSSVVKNRIMILALHRPFYQCPWARSSAYRQISIRRLSRTESEEMLHNILKVQEVAAEVKDLVQRKAEGNPFFMEELILELLESGLVRNEGNICRLADQAVNPPVPATVQDVIMARIDRLEDIYKRTLQLASVIGREFVYTILQKIAEPGHELGPALQALQQSELITEKSFFPELEYMFKHALTQDVAYNSLLLKQRRVLHTRVAAAIEEIKNNSLEEHLETLAYHYKKGDRPDKAFEFLVRAGEKAMEFSSLEVAKGYFIEALIIASEHPKSESFIKKEQAVRSQLQRLTVH